MIEREPELAIATEMIAAARAGRGAVLAIEAPAGTGKTTVLRALCESAEGDMRVLRARGGDLEVDLAFGVVRQLLAAPAAERTQELLRGAAALAGPILGLEGPPPAAGGDPIGAALHGLHWLVGGLAAEQPLVLAVDDAHWADAGSLRFLSYLARRVDDLPVLVAVGLRPGESRTERQLIDALLTEDSTRRVQLGPLSPLGSAELVRGHVPDATDALIAACHDATGGNPFLLEELSRSIAESGAGARTPATEIHGMAPETVARAVLVRISRLSASAAALASAVALFPHGAHFRHVARLAELDEAAAAAAADSLAEAHVLAAGRPLTFLHPLLRAAVHNDIPPAARARAHHRAAGMLAEEGAPAEVIAAHLLLAEPAGRAETVTVLSDAAESALSLGAPETAIRYLERALEEPPAPHRRAPLLHRLGLAELLAGRQTAVSRLRQVMDQRDDLDTARAAAFDLGRTLGMVGAPVDGARVIDTAIDLLPANADPQERLRLDAEAIWLLWQHPDGADELHRRIDLIPEDLPGKTLAEQLLLCYKVNRLQLTHAPAAEVIAAADRALAAPHIHEGGLDAAPPLSFAVTAIALCGQIRRAYELTAASTDAMRRKGAIVGVPMGHAHLSGLAWLSGDLREAEGQARLALDSVADQSPHHPARRWGLAGLLRALADQGRIDEALALCEAGEIAIVDSMAVDLVRARALVRSYAGDLEGALADLCSARSWLEAIGETDPAEHQWRADATIVLARMGRPDDALEAVDPLLREARKQGADWTLGQALRAAASAHEGGERIALLEDAASHLASSQASLLYAKTLVDLGAALRRARRRTDCRAPLREGLELARRCGAARLAAWAEEELGASGARLVSRALTGAESLTASEMRISRLAADGRTNREIAEELWLTQKTVEMHLRNAYRKLDISSRGELAAALAA